MHLTAAHRENLTSAGEVGAGDSDLIVQAQIEFNRSISSNAEMYYAFRYVYYDFASGFPLADETAYGPEMGMKIQF